MEHLISGHWGTMTPELLINSCFCHSHEVTSSNGNDKSPLNRVTKRRGTASRRIKWSRPCPLLKQCLPSAHTMALWMIPCSQLV